MKQAELATERVTVLMTPVEKSALEMKAREARVSVGEYVRRSVDAFDSDETDGLVRLAALTAELARSNEEASAALDRALASVGSVCEQLARRRLA